MRGNAAEVSLASSSISAPGDNNCRSRQRKAMSKRIPFHDGLAVRWQRLKILMGWFTVTDTPEFRVVC